jgi:uncharacterized protein (DUF488 family)
MSSLHKSIWTIGHSTHSASEFVTMLESFHIQLLADIRRFPGSKRYPHFNKEELEKTLSKQAIAYKHLEDLGGRRKANADSKNTAWRHPAFRGYADYMESNEFKKAIVELEEMALKQRTAIMCSEAVWWSCHRSLVSDYLKVKGWKVIHIMGTGKSTEHPFTSAARVVDGELSYKGLI